jgi:hypothetical protein
MPFLDVLRLRHWLRSMRGNFLCLLFALSFSLLATPAAHAQSASISGQVVDPSGASTPNVDITLTNIRTNSVQRAKTNGTGIYNFPFVTPGAYSLHAEATGFKPYTQTNITVQTAQNLEIDFRLAVGDTSESVTVNGSGNEINTTDASVSTVIDRLFVQQIPLNGRSFQSLLTAIPGASIVPSSGEGQSGEVSVNGQRTESNYFTIDGVSANTGAAPSTSIGFGNGFSGSTPGETVLGTTQSLISIDALEEFRATTSTYSAEYGRSPGGQFIFNSRSGTNQWHGSAYDYFRNDALDANNYFNKSGAVTSPRPAERQNDFGGVLGGPLHIPNLYKGTDKTFFFFSYEGMRLTNPQAIVQTTVPTNALRQAALASLQTILNAYPIANGDDRGDGLAYFSAGYSSPSRIDATSIRIDHMFNDRFQFFGRFSYTPANAEARSDFNLAHKTSTTGDIKTLTLGATGAFTRALSNDFRFNFTQNNQEIRDSLDSFGGATPYTLGQLPGLTGGAWFGFNFLYGLFPLTIIQPQSVRQRQINVVDSMDFLVGEHKLKWGIDYRRIVNTQALPTLYEYGYVFDQTQVMAPTVSVSGFLRNYSERAFKPAYENFSAFVQDECRLSPRISLSYGLRWELNPAPTDADGHNPYTISSSDIATTTLAPQNTSLWKTSYSSFAPRFGVAYQVHQRTGYETTLRAGAGLFYDTGNTQGSGGYNGIGTSAFTTFSNSAFPVSPSQIDNIPPISATAPYNASVIGYDPNLKLPYTIQWNVAVEQGIGTDQSLTLNYVASIGDRLLLQRLYNPEALGNPAFSSGNGLYLTTNGASSTYNALQVKFQRRLRKNLQALMSYTWSHAQDDATSNYAVFELERADSDYDIRHNFQAAATYDLPVTLQNRLLSKILAGWSLDARVSAHSALPVDVIGNTGVDPNTGVQLYYHPNRIPGVPLYLQDASVPGGRIINCHAFVSDCADPSASLPAGEGNAGRNAARGFDAVQADVALRKDFAITEKVGLLFRVEAFNVFNHAIFGSVYNQLLNDGPLFGQAMNTQNAQLGGLSSLYQVGGPRSLQLALRLHF